MRTGVRLGLDPGDARVGVARCDPSGVLATPLETVKRGKGDVARIRAIVSELAAETSGVIEVVVGLPLNLKGQRTPSTDKAREFAHEVAVALAPLPVRLVDERLTTVSAEAQLRERGRKGQDRRSVVDMAAAVLILQHALDAERASARPPGTLVEMSA